MEPKFILIAVVAGIALAAYIILQNTNWKHKRKRNSAKRVAKKIQEMQNPGRIFGYLRKIDPFVFEEMLLDAFHDCGIQVVRNARYSGDGGVDGHIIVDGRKIPIQAKRYKKHINKDHMRQFSEVVRRSGAPFGLFIHTGLTGKGSYEVAGQGSIVIVSGERLIRLLRRDKAFVLAILRNGMQRRSGEGA